MAAMLLLILYVAPIVWIPIRFGVRNGCLVEKHRESWKELVVGAAMRTGAYTIFFVLVIFLYMSFARFDVSTHTNPTPLFPMLRDGFVCGFGMAVTTSIPVGIMAIIAQRITIRQMGNRLKNGHCYDCGYDLMGNVSGRCPECGQAASAS